MSETPAQGDPQEVPPQLELEQADHYSQYLLYSQAEILAVLRSLIQKGAMITVYFDQGNSFLLSSMLALSDDHRSFILDVGSNDEMNRRALLARTLSFTSLVDKVKIQFSVNSLSATRHAGRPAFLASVPETLLRLQRREYFRLATPIAHPVRLTATVRRPDGSAVVVQVPLYDVSGGGIGLMAPLEQAGLFQRGETLADCKIALPDEGLLVTNLAVRNLFDVTARSGAHYIRVGCEYVDLPPQRLTMVQRYITRVERERKARLSGMG